MSIKGTETEKNLLKSFAGESQARNRYGFYAKQAKKDGYVQISEIFEDTANQEMQHAKTMFRFLEGGDLEITATYPAGKIGSTLENLKASAGGENEEWTELYPEFAKIAKEEGFNEISQTYKAIAIAEKQHEDRYRALIKNIEENTVFSKNESTTWRCRKCGYIHEGKSAVEKCPACSHPQAYFEEVLGLVSL